MEGPLKVGYSAAPSRPVLWRKQRVPAARPEDSRPYAARAGSPLLISGRVLGRGRPRPGLLSVRHTVHLHWEILKRGFRCSNLLFPSCSWPNRELKWVTRPSRQPLFGGRLRKRGLPDVTSTERGLPAPHHERGGEFRGVRGPRTHQENISI